MTRFRWALLLLISLVAVGVASSAVLAGPKTTKATTYWNNAVFAESNPGASLDYGDFATWTFDVYNLRFEALSGSVWLNLAGHSQSVQIGGGSGYNTTVRVAVTGAYTQTFTATLANPWRPHVAYNNDPSVGWDAYASLNLPNGIWRTASHLTVKVTSLTTNTHLDIFDGQDGVVIGYASLG